MEVTSPVVESSVEPEKQENDVVLMVSSSTGILYNNQYESAVKDVSLMDKISEIDEIDQSLIGFESRPLTTRPPEQRSQVNLRSSSRRKDTISETSQRRNEKVLITQPNDEETDNDDDLEDWDFETADELSKKKQILEMPDVDISDENAFDTDLEEEPEPDKKLQQAEIPSPETLYEQMCENLKVIPCRYFLAHLDNQKLYLRYHQFSPDEIRAIAKPLWNNYQVEKLYLDGNWIEENGMKYIARMIRQNDFITELSLTNNRLGETLDGTIELTKMLTENCILRKLNLSGNLLSDKDAELLIKAFERNRLLKELDLSHNDFGDDSAKFLSAYISSNDTLEVINLSWNKFRNKSAKEIANGLRENITLKSCNLSFNGFDHENGKAIADILKVNNTLESLSFSNARVNAESAAAIANSILTNETIKSLDLSCNPITSSGALAIIYAVRFNPNSQLDNLDLSEIPVTKDFENICNEIVQARPDFKCSHGTIMRASNSKSILYDAGNKIDFEKILKALKEKG